MVLEAMAMAQRGCVSALVGKAYDAVQTISAAIAAYRSTGATVSSTSFLSFLSLAYADLGKFNDAKRCIGQAVTRGPWVRGALRLRLSSGRESRRRAFPSSHRGRPRRARAPPTPGGACQACREDRGRRRCLCDAAPTHAPAHPKTRRCRFGACLRLSPGWRHAAPWRSRPRTPAPWAEQTGHSAALRAPAPCRFARARSPLRRACRGGSH